jgi:Rieske Fe-S protein
MSEGAVAGGPTRRFAGPGLVVVAAGVAGYVVAKNSDAAGPKPATAAANYAGGGTAGGTRLAGVDEVPPGGGVILDGAGVVLTRDAGGTVRGFSAVCTHQGCTVSSVQNGTINCPCHGSRFDVRTGAPVAGPASRPLPAVPVAVRDGAVFTG